MNLDPSNAKRSFSALISRAGLILYLLLLFAFSFRRYYFLPIDGDLPAIVLPASSFDILFRDPFGFSVLLHNAVYESPNRFFAHWLMSAYFRNAPLLLQYFVSPIKSVYLSIALSQVSIEIILVYVLAAYSTGKTKPWEAEMLLASAILAPLFQTFGFYPVMGIIDHAVTYTFCYALALALVMLFFLPYFNAALGRRSLTFRPLMLACLIVLLVIISFNGPMNPPVILIVCSLALLFSVGNNYANRGGSLTVKTVGSLRAIPPAMLWLFALAIVMALYSLYVGRNNSANSWAIVPLFERYSRLLHGMYFEFTNKCGWTLLWGVVLINGLLIYRQQPTVEGTRILRLLKWFVGFTCVYITALPLGGFRAYRPDIIRYDTVMPITLALIACFGTTTYYLLRKARTQFHSVYAVALVGFLCIFFYADAKSPKLNTCEWAALDQLARSKERIVLLNYDCSVLAWDKVLNYEGSEVKTQLLRHWNVIHDEKFFFQN